MDKIKPDFNIALHDGTVYIVHSNINECIATDSGRLIALAQIEGELTDVSENKNIPSITKAFVEVEQLMINKELLKQILPKLNELEL